MRVSSVCFAALLWVAGPPLAVAAIETTECRLQMPHLPTATVECGTLSVPENPDDPNGRRIDLFVAIVPALSQNPRPDPLVLINGGPGGATTDLFLQLRPAFEPILRERNIIIVDQRGTGRSAPLSCDDVDAEDLEIADPGELSRLVAECVAALDGDPRYYTTSVAVRDLDLVRSELGIAAWNLYGISYGTRVAQHYLRRHGEHVRAVILDGILPPELDLGPEIAEYAQRTLDSVFSRCAADPDCVARFRDLDGALASLFDRLAAEPLVLSMPDPVTGATSTQTMTTRHLQAVLRLMSYSPDMAALLPLLISEANAGRFEPLAAQSQMIIGDVEKSISFPMHNSVVCTEDVAPLDGRPEEPLADSYLGSVIVDALRSVCAVWPAGVIDDDLKTPFSSSTPALLLSGESDPITPPEYGEAVLENLTNARHLVGPGQGHGLAPVGCVRNIMRRFLDDLDPGNLSAACLDRESHAPFFLDFTGPAP